jgi:hypothetical protein
MSGQAGGFLELIVTFLVLPLLYVAFAEDKVSGCKVRIQFNRFLALLDCSIVSAREVVA